MFAKSTFRRSSSALGAAGVLTLAVSGPAAARLDPGTGQVPRCTAECFLGPDRQPNAVTPATQVVEEGVQLGQLGAGVLAGAALTGAAVAIGSRLSNRARPAHPV